MLGAPFLRSAVVKQCNPQSKSKAGSGCVFFMSDVCHWNSKEKKWESKGEKRKRLAEATSRKARKMCGWNVFLRESLKQKGALDPDQYKQEVRNISSEWKALPQDDKSAFEVQAEFEEQNRLDAKETPLASKKGDKPSVESLVGTKALKKLSACRLQHNFRDEAAHPIWTSPCQLGDSAFALAK